MSASENDEYKQVVVDELRESHNKRNKGMPTIGAWCGIWLDQFTKEELYLIIEELGAMYENCLNTRRLI